MKLLITGAYGQLGLELQKQATRLAYDVLAVDRDVLDISDIRQVRRAIDENKPDYVLNAAAYTAVDQAEEDAVQAFAVNETGVEHLATVCEETGIPLIHYSTDYVFDGLKKEAYTEQDDTSPSSVYGESKRAGERTVQAHCAKHMIFRTSWVFSAHGNNFVKTMLRLGADRETLGVVADQYGKPTSAAELARITLEVLPQLNHQWGVYHVAQAEAIHWHGFATAIFNTAKSLGVPLCIGRVNKIQTKDYPTPAKRPANSVLNCDKIEQTFGISIQPWRESLIDVIKELNHG